MNGGEDLNQHQPQQNQQQHQQRIQWMAMHQYQQHLMAMQMQYPAVTMHQNMIYGQPYMPAYYPQQHQMYQQQYHQHKQSNQIQSTGEENRTIWIGDLQQWMDEAYLQSCFASAGEVVSVKVIRNKQTGQSERYGFVEFGSHAAADTVLQNYNGSPMPNSDQSFRLNWAAFSVGNKSAEPGSDLSIFVGDLAPDVTDTMLHETFSSRYQSVKGAKVVVDTNTGSSKGYGFVRFSDENERTRAMTEMNGAYCSSRPMRIGVATPKKHGTQLYSSQAVIFAGGYPLNGSAPQGYQSDGDSSNTTIFVGGLDADVTDDELRRPFLEFGEVVSVKIPSGKGCGFVQFSNRSNAEEALQSLNGTVIGKQTIRLSWGRNPVSKQWNGGGYGRQGYMWSGYVMPQNQDREYAVAVANGASSNGYGNHHQQSVK